MGIFNRIVDGIDNAVTDARVHSSEHRKARKFAQGVRPGDTVYSVETHRMPMSNGKNGQQPLVHEHTVGRNGRIGHQTVEGWYLTAGDPSTTRPRGMTKREYDAMQVAGPDAGQAARDARVDQPKRGIFGGRRAA